MFPDEAVAVKYVEDWVAADGGCMPQVQLGRGIANRVRQADAFPVQGLSEALLGTDQQQFLPNRNWASTSGSLPRT